MTKKTPDPVLLSRTWPTLEIQWPALADPALNDLLLARLDDFQPTAIQEHERDGRSPMWRVFFQTAAARADARDALAAEFGAHGVTAVSTDVDDENWAARSQAQLTAVTVGRFIVAPPWDLPPTVPPDVQTIVIEPSTGFGTGHHASTRLCLRVLQTLNPVPERVLDIGTGSGVLAIAAVLCGATDVLAIDIDDDALASARDNATRNGVTARIRFERADFRDADLPQADLVLANLTGAMLGTGLERVIALTAPGGTLVLSGFTSEELVARADGPAALSPHVEVVRQVDEEGWRCLVLRRTQAMSNEQ